MEHIDDEADSAGINFVKIDDKQMAKELGVFALPAILFFKTGSKEPVIYAGDLYDEQQILQWLLTQKDPSGDVIEMSEGSELIHSIDTEDALAVYFCKYSRFSLEESKKRLAKEKNSLICVQGTRLCAIYVANRSSSTADVISRKQRLTKMTMQKMTVF